MDLGAERIAGLGGEQPIRQLDGFARTVRLNENRKRGKTDVEPFRVGRKNQGKGLHDEFGSDGGRRRKHRCCGASHHVGGTAVGDARARQNMRGGVDRAGCFQKMRRDRAVQRQALRRRRLFVDCLPQQVVLEGDRGRTFNEDTTAYRCCERIEHRLRRSAFEDGCGVSDRKRPAEHGREAKQRERIWAQRFDALLYARSQSLREAIAFVVRAFGDAV